MSYLIINNIYLLFSGIGILSAIMVIVSKNPVHSVLFLILTFFNCASLLIILEVEFLSTIFIIIYVGAIAILFLFVVMMLNIKIVLSKLNLLRYLPVGILYVIILYSQISSILHKIDGLKDLHSYNINYTSYIMTHDMNMNNIQLIGYYLYTYFIDVFLLSSVILLLAMIGAISLTLRKKDRPKSQVVHKQLLRIGYLNLYK